MYGFYINQTYENWELLAINDDSTDDCLSILKEFSKKDCRINTLNNPNPGFLKALRYGYSKSNRSLIHRIDSDDIMPKEKL